MKHLLFLLIACAIARAGVTVEKNIEYGKAGAKALLLDVYKPDGPAQLRGAVIAVHGGGWAGGKKEDMGGIAREVAEAGFVVFSVSYRLVWGEEGRWPAPLDDTQRAVRWVRANAAKYEVDPARIGAIGASAGGHLVSLLGMLDTRDDSDPALAAHPSRVQAVVDIFGPSELNEDYSKKVKLGLQANGLIKGLLGGTPEKKPEAAREASPLHRLDAKSAPFLIFHGRKDSIVHPDQSERLHAALQKAGVASELVIFEDEDHGFAKPANQAVFREKTAAFFKKHLTPAGK